MDDNDPRQAIPYDANVRPGQTQQMLELLDSGDIEMVGLMPWSSNGTFYVQVRHGDLHAPAIYKPAAAERPLWDFPNGLWKREIAMWELSEILGFGLVPPTVATAGTPDGGKGSLQAFVPARFEDHYLTLRDPADPQLGQAFRRLCALDLVANSTDRKSGHCLIDGEDHIWAIDNGLSFHAEFKLRTVIWDFGGEVIAPEVLEPLSRLLADGVPVRLARWLDQIEIDAIGSRLSGLLVDGRFPQDPGGRRIPWPLI